jgi:hypothetical protein
MEVREIAGACGVLTHVVPTLWRADATTVCILLDNPKTGHWIVITLDACGEAAEAAEGRRSEVA